MVFFSYAAVAAVQLLYPTDYALPFSSAYGERVGLLRHDSVTGVLTRRFLQTQITLVAGTSKVTTPLINTGAELSGDRMAYMLEEYPFWQRFIPFSLVWKQPKAGIPIIEFNARVLAKFSETKSKELTSRPTNAYLAIQDGRLKAIDDAAGYKTDTNAISTALQEKVSDLGGTYNVPVATTKQPAATTSADFIEVKSQAEVALSRHVSISIDGQTFSPSDKEIASWLFIGLNAKKHADLEFRKAAFNTYIDTLDKKVGRSAGTTSVTFVDGTEKSRIVGTPGLAITRDPLRGQIAAWLLTGDGTSLFTASLHEVSPGIVVNNKYTSSQKGLQAYLNDAAKRMDVHIAIQQIGSNNWHASVRSGDGIPSASTYKLYIAKWLFDRMDEGKVHWTDSILDTNVSGCFDRMTIASTNPCAEEWLRQIGRTNLNNYIYSLGFSHGTSFTLSDATHTTANDLLKMMRGINDGTLMHGSNRDRLLHNLNIHPYRYGIPTGSKGIVYDKVGFLWDYVHDAAIVRHPKGVYCMVIMTKGQSYKTIASLTRDIEEILYP